MMTIGRCLFLRTIAAAALVAVLGGAAARAEDDEKKGDGKKGKGEQGEQVTVTGELIAKQDDQGKFKNITLKVSETEQYRIQPNAKGTELAKALNGKRVEVTGMLTVKEEKKRIKVLSFKEATAPATDEKPAGEGAQE